MTHADRPASVWYTLMRPPGRLLFRALVGWRVEGLHHVPPAGGVIVVANHVNWLDPPLLALVLPRPIYFMAKQELFRNRIVGRLLASLGAYPVARGKVDRRALAVSADLLRRGHMISVFPEGTRSRDGRMGPAHHGAALLALQTGAAILPLGLRRRYGLARPVYIRVGPPLYARPGERREELTQRIMAAIEALVPAE